MLLEFSCSNYKSVRNNILFTTIANTDTDLEDKLLIFEKYRILRSAVIFGANGSGKSNFVDAMDFMRRLVTTGMQSPPGQKIMYTPHSLEGPQKETSFAVQFISDGTRYAYGFTLRDAIITAEYLFDFPNGRRTCIFERDADGFTPGSKFRGKFAACKGILGTNRLLLSCAASVSPVPEILSAFRFFSQDLIIVSSGSLSSLLTDSLTQIAVNPALKDEVISFLRSFDMGIRDIAVEIHDAVPAPAGRPAASVTAKLRYDTMESDLFLDESDGIRKLLAVLCVLIDTIRNGKVLVIDDYETHLHRLIALSLIQDFMRLHLESPLMPQIFFTSHDTGFLSTDFFRRDQIWFTELRQDRHETALYPLSSLKSVRKGENFERAYLLGKYGAVPNIHS